MNEEYKPGDWGYAVFTRKRLGMSGRIHTFGQIKAVERSVILFEDDHIEYIISKKEFLFEKKEAPSNL